MADEKFEAQLDKLTDIQLLFAAYSLAALSEALGPEKGDQITRGLVDRFARKEKRD